MAIETARIRILVGMVASGKSGYSRLLAENGWVIMSDDSIVTAVHGGLYQLYDRKLKPLYKSTENHIAAMALALGRPVAIDRGTNMSVSARRRWIGLAKSFDVPCEAAVFPFASAEEHARRRSASDPRGREASWWTRVAESHLEQYEEPTVSEGLETVFHLEEHP